MYKFDICILLPKLIELSHNSRNTFFIGLRAVLNIDQADTTLMKANLLKSLKKESFSLYNMKLHIFKLGWFILTSSKCFYKVISHSIAWESFGCSWGIRLLAFHISRRERSWNQVFGWLRGKLRSMLKKLTPSAFCYTLIFFFISNQFL